MSRTIQEYHADGVASNGWLLEVPRRRHWLSCGDAIADFACHMLKRDSPCSRAGETNNADTAPRMEHEAQLSSKFN